MHVRQALLDSVRKHALRVGAALPSERELAATHGVSRITIRRAMDDLVRAGYLARRRGSRALVCDWRGPGVEPLVGIVQDGVGDVRHELLEHTVDRVRSREAFETGMAPGSEVHRATRLHLAGDTPIAVEYIVVDAEHASELTSAPAREGLDADEIPERSLRTVHRLGSVKLTHDQARRLDASAGDVALRLERRTFNGGRQVEYRLTFRIGEAAEMAWELT